MEKKSRFNKRKVVLRTLSLMLSLMLLISMVPAIALAGADENETTVSATSPEEGGQHAAQGSALNGLAGNISDSDEQTLAEEGGNVNNETTYRVTFMVGEISYASTEVESGNMVDESAVPNPTIPEDYDRFAGWFYDSEGESKFEFSSPVIEDLTLFAVFTPADEEPALFSAFASEEIMVTFLIGENVYETVPVERGQSVTEPPAPDEQFWPEGMLSFHGWFAVGSDVAFDFTTPITTSLELCAEFNDQYLIKYKDADGKVVDSKLVKPGNVVPQTSVIITPPTGQRFAYWYIEGSESIEEGTYPRFDLATRVNENFTLKPYFTDRYYVYFYSQGTQVDPVSLTADEVLNAPPAPTRAGYMFSHWSAEGYGESAYAFGSTVQEDLRLYANWTPAIVQYQIVYWFEKPNFFGDPGNDPDNYLFSKSVVKTARAGSVVDLTSGSELDTVQYGYFGFGESKTISGAGTTVINVYFKRTLYTFEFDLNPGTNNTTNRNSGTMSFNGDTYAQGMDVETGTVLPNSKYSFKAKFEQDIENLWPSSWNAVFSKKTRTRTSSSAAWRTVTISNFTSWTTPSASTSLVTKRFTVTADLIPTSGETITFTANWGSTSTKHVEYWFEALPHQTGSTVVTIGGLTRSFVKSEEQSQRVELSGTLNAKTIEGMTNIGGRTGDGTEAKPYVFYYTRIKSSLTFNSMGGTHINPITDILYGTQLDESYKPGNPTKTVDGGTYTFDGWYYDTDYHHPFSFGNNAGWIPGMPTMPNKNLTLFAKWKSTEHKVTFYAGAEEVGFEELGHGGYVTEFPDYRVGASYDGLGVFTGWVWYPLGSSYPDSFGSEIPINRHTDVYATFRTNGLTVTYNAGEGSGTVTDSDAYDLNFVTQAKEGKGLMPPAGKIFVGWTLSGSNIVYRPGTPFTVTGNMVFTARYLDPADTWKVTFKSSADAPETEWAVWFVEKNKSGTEIKLAGEIYTRLNETLVGWTFGATESESFELSGSYTVKEDIVFLGAWETQKWEITFQTDGKDSSNSLLDPADNNTSKYTIIISGIKNDSLWSETFSEENLPVPSAGPNYYFVGWTPGIPAGEAAINSNLTFTAGFEARTPLTIKADSAEKIYDGNPLTKNSASVTKGALKFGDRLVVTMTSGSTISQVGKVDNTINSYKIMRGIVEVTHEYRVTTAKGTLEVSPKPVFAYTINYYYVGNLTAFDSATITGVAYGTRVESVPDSSRVATGYVRSSVETLPGSITNNSTVIRVYYREIPVSPTSYTVTYNANGGAGTQIDTALYTSGSVVTLHGQGSVTRAGYTFSGWSITPDGQIITEFTITADTTVYAIWKETTSGGVSPKTPVTQTSTAAVSITPFEDVFANMFGGEMPTVNLFGQDVPLAAIGYDAWALANLLLVILGVVLTLILFFRNRGEDKDEVEERRLRRAHAEVRIGESEEKPVFTKKRLSWLLIAAVLAVAAICLFILTEDMALPMALIDQWTIFHLAIIIAQAVCCVVAFRKKKGVAEDTQKQRGVARKSPGGSI